MYVYAEEKCQIPLCVDVNLICVRDVSKIQLSNIRATNIMPGLNTAELN